MSHRPGSDGDGRGTSGQGGRAVSVPGVRSQTRRGGWRCIDAAAVVGLRVRVGGRRKRRRERRRDRDHEPPAGQRHRVPGRRRRSRPAVVVAGAGLGNGRGHGELAAPTGPGGQVVLPAQPRAGGAQRRDGHHQRQRTGVPVDRRWRSRRGRRPRPAQRTHGGRDRGDAAHRPCVPAPSHPARAALRRAHRRVQVSGGGLELGTPISLAPNGRIQ